MALARYYVEVSLLYVSFHALFDSFGVCKLSLYVIKLVFFIVIKFSVVTKKKTGNSKRLKLL